MSDYLVLCGIAIALLYWWDAQGVKQIAYRVCRQYLESRGLQLLDGYVRTHRVWLKRDENGNWRFWRSYLFEFSSTGVERYQGMAVALGKQVLHIELEAYHIPEDG